MQISALHKILVFLSIIRGFNSKKSKINDARTQRGDYKALCDFSN